MKLAFTVLGVAVPQGSMRSFVPKGWTRAITTHNNKAKLLPWRQAVAARAYEARGEFGDVEWPVRDPVELRATFYLPRPQSHFGKKGLRQSAPRFPAGKPDLSKLVRAAEDALTGIVYEDDARIVCEIVQKAYVLPGDAPHAEFEIEVLTSECDTPEPAGRSAGRIPEKRDAASHEVNR